MSWFFKILGNNTSNVAEVDSNSKLQVNLPITASQAGYAALVGSVDAGVVTGTPRVNKAAVTEHNALSTTQRMLLWDDTFNVTAQNTAIYKAPITTMTVTFPGGTAILNGGNITTINTNCALQTYRYFPLFGKSELRCTTSAIITSAPQANCVIEFGLFQATLPGAAIPTDGVFFRFNASGEFRGVINYNGTETQTGILPAPSINVNHDYTVVVQTNVVLFYVDDVLQGSISLISAASTLGQPMMGGSQPYTARQYIGGSAPSSPNQFKISDVFIICLGSRWDKPWSEVKSGLGQSAYQGQNGGTMGSLANYANSANPVAAVPTNTTAALGTGLGGQFWETNTLAVNTDGIICSFQNPAAAAAITGRVLYITGITINSYIQTILAGGPHVGNWSLAFGHTAVSLATAEAVTGTKAPRRIALGIQPTVVTQAVSTAAGTPISIRFATPVVVYPGEFIAVVKKVVGTVGSSGTIAHLITFDGYFE